MSAKSYLKSLPFEVTLSFWVTLFMTAVTAISILLIYIHPWANTVPPQPTTQPDADTMSCTCTCNAGDEHGYDTNTFLLSRKGVQNDE
jgi:hypothetical protein